MSVDETEDRFWKLEDVLNNKAEPSVTGSALLNGISYQVYLVPYFISVLRPTVTNPIKPIPKIIVASDSGTGIATA